MLMEIALKQLTPSPTNPRKTFDQVKLTELARSIGEVGVLEPILVRRCRALNPKGLNPNTQSLDEVFEVVAGERRFRAATIAEVETVPCIVKELTDVQVLEIQTIENLQRDDLHPLEEAQGYASLMKEARYDVDQIAQRISKSGKYVYDRIKLLQLIPELRTVFLAGEITAGHAILLARLSPSDQKRCLGAPKDFDNWQSKSGLFQRDQGASDPSLDLGDEVQRKARSVRELEAWIDDHVRFKPEQVDPMLFPDTAATLAAAAEEELEVAKITHSHMLEPETREEGDRTYSRSSWKRADGKVDRGDYDSRGKPSKECGHSVLGVVVAGRGRTQAFKVCTDKKKCSVHWPEEVKAAKRAKENRAQPGAAASPAPSRTAPKQDNKHQREQAARAAEEKRWDAAEPKLIEALAAGMKKAAVAKLIDVVVNRLKDDIWSAKSRKELGRGTTVDDGIRYAAFLILQDEISDGYAAPDEVQKALKPFGVDAKKIVDQVAPKEKPKKEAAPKKERKPAGSSAVERIAAAAKKAPASKKGARARRREKKSADAVKA